MATILKQYRTYFDKNNTIISNSYTNTAHNPVTELMCGSIYSRFLFGIDFNELKKKYETKELNLEKVTHTLKIKNTSNFDVSKTLVDNSLSFMGKKRARSVDLGLYLITEDWDEGVGYDYWPSNHSLDENDYSSGPSDWYNRLGNFNWQTSGAIQSGSTIITTAHLDSGSEDISMDVTNIVNEIIRGERPEYKGFVLKYTNDFEKDTEIPDDTLSIGFFTKSTQTFFEPFVETIQDINIYDNRRNFYNGINNKLYFYFHVDGASAVLDEPPTVIISDDISNKEFTSEQVLRGIYCVTVSGCTFSDYSQYIDRWTGLIYNGSALEDVELDFVVHPITKYIKQGTDLPEKKIYAISMDGIKMNEMVTQGIIRNISVHIREPYTPHFIRSEYKVFYSMYVKQGPNRVVVTDWQSVDILYNGPMFTVDTTWMVPQQYFIDIKVQTHDEVQIFNAITNFTVVSQI